MLDFAQLGKAYAESELRVNSDDLVDLDTVWTPLESMDLHKSRTSLRNDGLSLQSDFTSAKLPSLIRYYKSCEIHLRLLFRGRPVVNANSHASPTPAHGRETWTHMEVIAWEAFKDDLMGLMYPNGYTDAAKDFWIKCALEDWREDPEKVKFTKVIDTELPEDDPNNRIVGVAMWKFFMKDRTDEELQADEKKSEERGFSPDCNEALMVEFFGNIAKYKREILGGKAHVLLNLLATHPTYHRRGVGAMQLRWGNEHADQLGLPCYLEASPMGKPLYLREGYEVVSDFPFDARHWGHHKDLPHVCMLRPAKQMNGQP